MLTFDVGKVSDGVFVSAKPTTGCSPVWQAAQNGHIDVVTALVAGNADVNQGLTNSGATPLSIATQRGHTAIATLLEQHGAIPF
eukprot:gene21803-biopygen27367